jgi:hypothetical protein
MIKTYFAKKHGISLLRISYDATESQIKEYVTEFLTLLNERRIEPIYIFSNPVLYVEHQSVCQS